MGVFDRLGNLGKGMVGMWKRGDDAPSASREQLERELAELEAAAKARQRARPTPAPQPEVIDVAPTPDPPNDGDDFPEIKKTL